MNTSCAVSIALMSAEEAQQEGLEVDGAGRVTTCHLHQLMNEGVAALALVRLARQLRRRSGGGAVLIVSVSFQRRWTNGWRAPRS